LTALSFGSSRSISAISQVGVENANCARKKDVGGYPVPNVNWHLDITILMFFILVHALIWRVESLKLASLREIIIVVKIGSNKTHVYIVKTTFPVATILFHGHLFTCSFVLHLFTTYNFPNLKHNRPLDLLHLTAHYPFFFSTIEVHYL
jgi:hypothetical protein